MENKNILTIILAIGLILVSLLVIYENKVDEKNTINVVGSYSTKVDPDQVEINFNIVTEGKTAIEAQQKNSEIANNLIRDLKNSGLTDKDIETVNYYSNKKTVWENNSYVEKGYEVVNSMRIKTKDMNKVGDLIDIATKNGVQSIDSLSFTLSEEKKEQVYQEAISKAGENAKERAEKLASSIGFKIKGIKSVSLNSPVVPYYQNYGSGMLEANKMSTPIQPQSVDLTVDVSVVFEIS